MNRHLKILLIVFFALILTGVASAENALKPSMLGNKYVNTELVFDVETLQVIDSPNGKIARIGVLFKIEPGWHIYWKNPGDSGQATKIEWQLPESWKTSELLWPYPHRYFEKGGIKTYAYSDEVLLFADLIIPPIVPEKDIELQFGANVSFLVCKDRCVPGKQSLNKKINLSLSAPESPSANYKDFHRFEKLVPYAFKLEYEILKTNDKIIFKLPNTISKSNFFDSNSNAVSETLTFKDKDFNYLALSIDPTQLEEIKQAKTFISGVLVFEISGESKAIEISNLDFSKLKNIENIDLSFTENSAFTNKEELPENKAFIPQNNSDNSLLYFLLCAFIGGIILNFMPCVLPVISIKLFGLIEAKDRNKKENFIDSLWFSLGIILSLLTLAGIFIALKLSGQNIGWGFQFQNPKFIIGMILFLYVMALGFFDLLNFSILAFIPGLEKVSNNQARSRAVKSMVDGLLISVLSTPCTAPFLGTALVFAFTQPPITLLLIFLSIALGLSFPFFMIANNPKLLKFLPNPGHWMNHFKHFMGFGLLATIIWLANILESLRPGAVVKVNIILLCLSMILWIYKSKNEVSKVGKTVYTFMALGLVYLIYNSSDFSLVKNNHISKSELAWVSYSEDLETIPNTAKFIDFTAEWCITCKYNENFILNDTDVVKILKDRNFTLIKADWTDGNEVISKALKKYGAEGVPIYVIIKEDGTKKVVGPILTKDQLISELN